MDKTSLFETLLKKNNVDIFAAFVKFYAESYRNARDIGTFVYESTNQIIFTKIKTYATKIEAQIEDHVANCNNVKNRESFKVCVVRQYSFLTTFVKSLLDIFETNIKFENCERLVCDFKTLLDSTTEYEFVECVLQNNDLKSRFTSDLRSLFCIMIPNF